jgi:hypothetical protein
MNPPRNLPERKIIWEENGILQRLQKVETQIQLAQVDNVSGGSGESDARLPEAPVNLGVLGQTLVEDSHGQFWVEVEISWNGLADVFEVAVARVVT